MKRFIPSYNLTELQELRMPAACSKKPRLYILLYLLLAFSNTVLALTDDQVAELSLQVFSVQGDDKAIVVEKLTASGDKSLIPTLVLAMRWTGSNVHIASALSELTGESITTWHEAYHWQEQHPDVKPHSTYRDLKLRFLGNTDERFLGFFNKPGGAPQPMNIRLEEVVWGGALYEGIPSLDFPLMVTASQASYLQASDLVFGVEINGDVRAYPLRILGWHEMLNDEIGGIPVALAYCTLCGSAILYETQPDDISEPFSFGSSGLLFRSNKLMFDRQTHSLWNQFTGRPVVGPLLDRDMKLSTHPITITSWELWSAKHEDTKVLSLNTGFIRDYDSGVTYADYFASPDLMFPSAANSTTQILRKDYVFGVSQFAASKAWRLSAFSKEPVINDQVGATPLVVIGNEITRTVRAYERKADEHFRQAAGGKLLLDDALWEIEEEFLYNPSTDERRFRLAGHISYWFAWDSFMGGSSSLYEPEAH